MTIDQYRDALAPFNIDVHSDGATCPLPMTAPALAALRDTGIMVTVATYTNTGDPDYNPERPYINRGAAESAVALDIADGNMPADVAVAYDTMPLADYCAGYGVLDARGYTPTLAAVADAAATLGIRMAPDGCGLSAWLRGDCRAALALAGYSLRSAGAPLEIHPCQTTYTLDYVAPPGRRTLLVAHHTYRDGTVCCHLTELLG